MPMPPPLCRILYLEDEPDIRAIAQMALEAVGGVHRDRLRVGQRGAGGRSHGTSRPAAV